MKQTSAEKKNVEVDWASLWHLLDRAQQVLARVFHERWQLLAQGDWTPASARDFFTNPKGVGWPAFQKARPNDQVRLVAGTTERWDISLLCLVLQNSRFRVPRSRRRPQDQAIDALRRARNDLAHTPPSQLPARQANGLLQGVVSSLVQLGEDKAELDRFMLDKQQRGAASTEASEEVLAQAKRLKEEANKKHQAQLFDEAIKLYTDALALPLLPKDELAVLHSNRSAAHLGVGDLSSALQDGKEAQRLRPTWPKGYFRKGQALSRQRKWPKALKGMPFEWAFALDPTNKELLRHVAECKAEVEKQDRFEHFNAQYLPQSEEDVEIKLTTRFGQSTGKRERESLAKMFREMNQHGRAYVLEAHTYLMQPKLDYAKAARLLQLGVDHDSPEAMYNLAVLYREGRGVEKDLQKSQQLLNQAITHPPMDKLTSLRNIGVAEAQHALGKAYLDGLFGEKSLEKSLALIRRAADAEYAPAINSLGALYEKGHHGEAKDEKQAHEYYLAAAAGGDTVAMLNLAHLYTRGAPGVPQDLAKAKMWASRSVDNGNWGAQRVVEELQRAEQNREQYGRHSQELFNKIADPQERQSMRILTDMDQLMRKRETFDATPKTITPDPLELQARAGTSRTAAKELQIRTKISAAMGQLRQISSCTEPKELPALSCVLSSLAQVYEETAQLPRFPPAQRDRLIVAAETVIKADPSLEAPHVVWAGLHFYDGCVSAYLQRCCYDFPKSPFFFKLLGWRLAEDGKWEEAAHKYTKALQLCPDDLGATYSLAAVRKRIENASRNNRLETIKLYQQFLSRCEPDHPKAPEAHYGVGSLYMLLDDVENVRKHHQLGLDAEKRQLPMFLPYTSLNRDCLAVFLSIRASSQKRSQDSSGPVTPGATMHSSSGSNTRTEQARVVDVRRNQIRLHHRSLVRSSRDLRQPGMSTMSTTVAAPPKRQQANRGGGAAAMRTILLQDMDPTKDKVYKGCVIQGTIIDLPNVMVSLITVIQDAEGRVEKLALYNLPPRLSREITIGQRIAISNPYMRMAQDGKPMIRVDYPSSIKLLEKISICHFCTKQAAKLFRCGKCLSARYCSQQCQVSDWKELNHKDVCFSE